MRFQCPFCLAITDQDLVVFSERKTAGLPFSCNNCQTNLVQVGRRPAKHGRSDNQKRSKHQEEGVAKRTGAKRQKASGALPGIKGDVRTKGIMRGECKFTRAKSFSLKLAELQKIEHEVGNHELPAFFVEFQCQQPPARYVVVPEWVYTTLLGDLTNG